MIDDGKLPLFRGVELNLDDKIRKYVIMQFMSNFKINISDVKSRFNIDFNEYFLSALEALKEYEAADLVTISPDEIKATLTGTMVIRNLAMPFDGYLQQTPEDKRRFSKTI